MKPLNKNYWRLGWVFLTNGALSLLLLTGPVRVYYDHRILYETMGTVPPPLSYWKELLATPWVPVVVLVLLIGIVAELRRSVLSPIFTLVPYITWLIVALCERARVAAEASPQDLFLGKVLLIIPLAVIIAVDLIFYVTAIRRTQQKAAN